MAEKATQRRLMRERSRALATLLLTRRADVEVQDVGDDIGVDLIARIVPKGKSGLRQLGVELRYVLEPVTADHANKVLGRTLRQHHESYGPFPFPVALFFFTMRNDHGWYTWVAEPVVSADDGVTLRRQQTPSCQQLDEDAVDAIVGQVDRWYDAFYDKLSPAEPAGGKAKR